MENNTDLTYFTFQGVNKKCNQKDEAFEQIIYEALINDIDSVEKDKINVMPFRLYLEYLLSNIEIIIQYLNFNEYYKYETRKIENYKLTVLDYLKKSQFIKNTNKNIFSEI